MEGTSRSRQLLLHHCNINGIRRALSLSKEEEEEEEEVGGRRSHPPIPGVFFLGPLRTTGHRPRVTHNNKRYGMPFRYGPILHIVDSLLLRQNSDNSQPSKARAAGAARHWIWREKGKGKREKGKGRCFLQFIHYPRRRHQLLLTAAHSTGILAERRRANECGVTTVSCHG